MSEKERATSNLHSLQPLVDFWAASLQLLSGDTSAPHPYSGEGSDAADLKLLLEWASQTADMYLRSPVFLAALKNHIDNLIACRRIQRQESQKKKGGSGALQPADWDQQLKELEQQLSRRLEQLEQRLEGLSKQCRGPEGLNG